MRAIKVTFRATFEQPIGLLNPLGARVPGPQHVELYKSDSGWVACSLSADGCYRGTIYKKLGRFASLEHAQSVLKDSFQEQIQPWEMWAENPNEEFNETPMTPYEIADLGDGKFGWIQDEDRTHILHGPLIRQDSKVPNAACGASVNAKCFINNKANVEPSCRGCTEVWRKEYQNK